MKTTNCVRIILQNYLKKNGYDGLYYPGECACKIDDLQPCDSSMQDCEPGYYQPDKEGFDFMLGKNKQTK